MRQRRLREDRFLRRGNLRWKPQQRRCLLLDTMCLIRRLDRLELRRRRRTPRLKRRPDQEDALKLGPGALKA